MLRKRFHNHFHHNAHIQNTRFVFVMDCIWNMKKKSTILAMTAKSEAKRANSLKLSLSHSFVRSLLFVFSSINIYVMLSVRTCTRSKKYLICLTEFSNEYWFYECFEHTSWLDCGVLTLATLTHSHINIYKHTLSQRKLTFAMQWNIK